VTNLSEGVMGVLINGKEFSDVVLERIAGVLRERCGVREVVSWNKGFPAKPAPFLDEIAQRCAFVLNGVGH
jgi:hypothetical protein